MNDQRKVIFDQRVEWMQEQVTAEIVADMRHNVIDDLVAKLKAVTDARGGADERIYVRGDKKVDYGTMMQVMGRLSAAGYHRVALVTEVEQGG